jgi:alpha-L-rhamnosidase
MSLRVECSSTRRTRGGGRRYRIPSPAAPRGLTQNRPDIWTPAASLHQSVQVVYAGKPLASRQPCFWKVRVYDQAGTASGWSAPAAWSMGLLRPADWQARWIGRDETPRDSRLKACSWIAFAKTANDVPGLRYYRRTFELPAGRALIRAELSLAGDNAFDAG